MSKKLQGTLIWIFSILFTLSAAYYQRVTGPTYALKGEIKTEGTSIKYKLPRSADSDGPAEVRIKNPGKNTTGILKFKRFKANEKYQIVEFQIEENSLIAYLPAQPPAGKLEYKVILLNQDREYQLTENPIVIRFKGPVPTFVLAPHILFMFLAMMLSTRTGLEAVFNRSKLKPLILFTVVFLFAGGLILGPVVQKYAFGAYWTGWPFGQDLTDNKTLLAFVFWLAALIQIFRGKKARAWVIAASIVLLMVYLIPHSMFGSELDYSTGEVVTGE